MIAENSISPVSLVKQQLGLIEVKDGKKVDVYKTYIDLNQNGYIDQNEIIDADLDGKVSNSEVWLFFAQNINILPKADVEKVVAAVAQEAQAGSTDKITYLGQLSFQSYQFVRQYRPIIELAAQSIDPKIKIAAQGALKMFDLAETAYLTDKISQFAPIKLETNDTNLSPIQIKVRDLLIKAAKTIDDIFWLQYSQDGITLKRQLEASKDPLDQLRLHYLMINYGRFDGLEEPKVAFIGEGSHPMGATFYPEDLTREEFDAFIKAHPEKEAEFKAPNTEIQRDPQLGLVAVPYENIYRNQLDLAAKYLQEAAEITDDPALKKYLLSKTQDLVSGDYFNSDRDWLALDNSPLDIIIGYMEVYDDELTGAKTSYEALVLQKDPVASQELDHYKKLLPEFQKNLPVTDELKSKTPVAGPIGVFDVVYAAGDANQTTKAYAVNLPNTEKVREQFGNRFILLNNVMKAKAQKILLPIAERIIDNSQLALVNQNDFASHGVMHELAHSLGLDYVVGSDNSITIRQALKETYSIVEECKADVLALYNLRSLNLNAEAEMAGYVTFLASIFRSIRFGVAEGHGRANLICLNFLLQEDAIEYNQTTNKWKISSLDKMRTALEKLSCRLLEIEGYGKYDEAKKLLEEMGKLNPLIDSTLSQLSGIPVDLEFIQ